MLKILITGGDGQVGSELRELSTLYAQYNYTFTNRHLLDLTNTLEIENFFADKDFDVIINCAAYTNVDKAESEFDIAELVNAKAVETLATIAKRKQISLVHISTDYVFDGNKNVPYLENDVTNPINNYGKSKLLGEKAIFEIAPERSTIIRSSWIYSKFGNNFVKTMLRLGSERESLGVISDQLGTPTNAKDLAKLILDIIPKINNAIPEIYHYSNEGETSWFEFAKTIFEFSNVNCFVNPILAAEYKGAATRPGYSLLNKTKIKNKFGITIPDWKESLKNYLVANKSS